MGVGEEHPQGRTSDVAVGVGERSEDGLRIVRDGRLEVVLHHRSAATVAAEHVVAPEARLEHVMAPHVGAQQEVVHGGLGEESQPAVERDEVGRPHRLERPHHLGLGAVIGTPGEEVVVGGRSRPIERVGDEGESREREHGGARGEPVAEMVEDRVQRPHVLTSTRLDVDRRAGAGEGRWRPTVSTEEPGVVRQRGRERESARPAGKDDPRDALGQTQDRGPGACQPRGRRRRDDEHRG